MAWPHCEISMACPTNIYFSPIPPINMFFLCLSTSASDVSPVLSPTNVTASFDTASCTAPVKLSVWFLTPRAPPNLLTTALLYLYVLVGEGLLSIPGPP